MAPPRSRAQRQVDARGILEASHADVWVASASTDGAPYLVPLSFAWDGARVIVALKGDSRTARNIIASGTARLGFGATRDVVMADVVLESHVGIADADAALVERYAGQADWNPADLSDRHEYLFLLLRPHRIQVWREANELAGRTVMRDGRWLESPDDP